MKAYGRALARIEERLNSRIIEYLGSSRFEEDVDSFIKHRVQQEIKKKVEFLLDRDSMLTNRAQSLAEEMLERIRKTRLKKNEIDALVDSVSDDYKSTIEQTLNDLAAERAVSDAEDVFKEAMQKLRLPHKKGEEQDQDGDV